MPDRSVQSAVCLIALALAGPLVAACASVSTSDGRDAAMEVVIPPPGTVGARCTEAADCASAMCLPSGVCSGACAASSPCPQGWTCEAGACECVASAEICDGRDNDCNGRIDDGLTTCACPLGGQTRCGAACVDLTDDRTNCGACGNACAASQVCRAGACIGAQLDLLFMIDNSNGREDQANLLLQLGPMLHALTLPPCTSASNTTPHACSVSDPTDRPAHPPVTDLHVGVVSSDLGTPGSSVPGCSNSATGDDGRLNPIRNGLAISHHEPWTTAPSLYPRPSDCDDPNEFPSFIAFDSTTTDATTFVHDMQCNVGLYVNGCGLESQLEAIHRALITYDATDAVGNTSPNAGFVRANAVLAILVLTDEEDGSVRDCRHANGTACTDGAFDVYNPVSDIWASRELNLRMYMYQPCGPQDPTWPLDRYLDPANPQAGWLSLKPGHPERVVFGAITGVPLAIPMRCASVDWDGLLGAPGGRGRDDFCARDSSMLGAMTSAEGPVSMMQANADPNCAQRVVPACRREGTTYAATSCTTDVQFFAWPARRVVEIARRFDQMPLCDGLPCHNAALASICHRDDAAIANAFVQRVQARL